MNEIKPGKFQAIALLQLITGILSVVTLVILTIGTCGMLFLGVVPIYALVTGIMAIVSGARGLGQHPQGGNYKTVAIMQIVAIISLDIWALVSGILCLVFLSDPEIEAYLRGESIDQ